MLEGAKSASKDLISNYPNIKLLTLINCALVESVTLISNVSRLEILMEFCKDLNNIIIEVSPKLSIFHGEAQGFLR